MAASRTSETARAVVLVLLMLTMSMSAGIVDLNRAPWAPTAGETFLPDSAPCVDTACGVALASVNTSLDVRMLLDPTDPVSYPGSGTTLNDLSPYGNDGTLSGATWDGDFTRFNYAGTCSGSPGSFQCDETSIANDGTLRPGQVGEDLAVELNAGATTQYFAAASGATGKDVGAIEKAFTVALWVKPTDCDNTNDLHVLIQKEYSYHIGCKNGLWFFGTGSGSGTWYNTEWLNTSVPAEDDVWQHVAITRPSSGSGTTFHLNGVAAYNVTSYEGDLAGSNSQPLTVGASLSGSTGLVESGSPFPGWVDDVRIYTSDRGSTVASDMHTYPTVNDANLNAFFDFNIERHGDTVTGLGNQATGTGAASLGLSTVVGSPFAERTWSVGTDGSDTVLTFERTVLTAPGGWRVPIGVDEVDLLAVGGGGGGGHGGGGGGGVNASASLSVNATEFYPVIVGVGGAAAKNATLMGEDGGVSSAFGAVAYGGGAGAVGRFGCAANTDGPGGGASFDATSSNCSANGGVLQGYEGGISNANTYGGGGGGGGAGSAGQIAQASSAGNANNPGNGGGGGNGVTSNITGASVTYGGGGGGGANINSGASTTASVASGGSGGGGAGSNTDTGTGTNGNDGLGGGGGGSDPEATVYARGGHGVVIVRFATVDTDGWTVSTWFNTSTLQGSVIIGAFDSGGTASDVGWALRMKYNGAVYATVGTTGNGSAAWTPDAYLDANRWYHAVMVADVDSTLTLYIDGQQVGQASLSNSGAIRDVANDVYIGSYNGGEYSQPFAGQIGAVLVGSGVLSSSSVGALYTATKGAYSNTTVLNYTSTDFTADQDQSFSTGPVNVTNGSLTTEFALDGYLPSGLTFETSNGTVWGTPMWYQANTTYTVHANNSAGSYTTTFNLTVNPPPPVLSFSGYDHLTFTVDSAISTVYPSNTGGSITTCSVEPTLPSGLAIGSTCALSGTPTEVSANTTYTVNGSNAGGYDTATFNLTVNDVMPGTPVYAQSSFTLELGTSVNIAPPTVGGGTVVSWEVSPSLPSGLTLNNTTGAITGTPLSLQVASTTYTVWANNSGGSASTTFSMSVLAVAPSGLTYSPSALVLTINTTMTPVVPTVTGGAITSWWISADGPDGLFFGPSNGTIWGTPTETTNGTLTFMIWANNSGGSTATNITLAVVHAAPGSFSYSPENSTLTLGDNLDLEAQYDNSTFGNITSWAISDSLPSGVTFHTNNGTIEGTPNELWPETTYWVWANNSGGSSVAYLNLTVVDNVPTLSYPSTNLQLTKNTPGNGLPLEATLTGAGTITTWTINASLPSGLTFGYTNGTVYGTPDELWATTAYTVWANNSGGSTVAYFNLTVVDQVPIGVTYTPSGQWVWVNGTLSTMTPAVIGSGTVTAWTLSPASLPEGAVFNTTTGTVTGTPTQVWANTTYTVEASNSGGSVSTTFWLHVRQQAPSITYNVTNVTLVSNVSSVLYSGTNSGGSPDLGLTTIDGYSDVFCAIDGDGQVWCWGSNADKVVNRSASTNTAQTPVLQPLPAGRYATSVGVGYNHACALLDNGSVACWGDAGDALSGSAVLEHYDGDGYVDPVLIPGLGGDVIATSLDVGFTSACVTVASGVPMCWGSNTWYTLGIGNSAGTESAPLNMTVVPTGRSVVSLSHGTTHVCALLDNASVMCWGDNSDGQLGDGTVTARSSPVWPNLGGRAVGSLEAGDRTTCVGFVDGGAACWGDNSDGQVGDGTFTDRRVPTNVSGAHASAVFTAFTLTYDTSCALLGNGTTVCWGDEAGQSDTNVRTTPVEVTHGAGVRATSLAGDFDTICSVLSNGSVACWGWNYPLNFGVLESVSSSSTPVAGVLGRDARSNPGGWYLNGTLPAGLQFSPLNGTLWGTPSEVLPEWFNSTVSVQNSAGMSSYTFSMRVIDSLPTLSYTPANLSLVRGVNGSSWSLAPTLTGPGDIASWVIEPALPSGLLFGANNGTLYGASSVLLSTTAYTVWANNSGGSNVAYLNLTVVDQTPVLSYASSNLTLVRDGSNPDLPLEAILAGGAATSWAISSPLPSGLTFDTTNGTILGNPLVNASLTVYTIWANNTGGSAAFVLNLTVVEPTPGLVYSPTNLTLTRGVAMTPLSPTTYGGVAEAWAVHPTLPSGLNFNNGLITGTPSVNLTTTTFTVWANNSQGQASVTLNLTVVEPVVSLFYASQHSTLYRGIASSAISPTYSGGAVHTWSILPALPSGLNFTNGVIDGTPTATLATTMFTVWANNSGGSTSATLNLTVLEPTVVLTYSAYDITLIRNVTTLSLAPSVSGGTPTSWAIEPTLPAGLSFSQGAFSGKALVNQSRTMFTVWANTTGGSTAVFLNLTVVEPVVSLTFNPSELVIVRNASMNPIAAGFNGGDVDTWSIHPDLPAGLQFVDGVLSGTPLANASRTMHTVWANNSGGSSSVMFNLTVTEPMLDFGYTPNAMEAVRDGAVAPFGPTVNNDAAVASWGIAPALPSGLTFSEGWITGTPTENATATVYTVWANNSGGASTAQFTLTVLEPVAVVTYPTGNVTVTRDLDSLLVAPVLSGGSVATWTIEPALPAGLTFANGTVSGVPTTSFPTTMFTVNATNSGGFALAFLNITSLEPIVVLAPIEDLVLVRLGERANASINHSGGAVASWAIEPALPSGVRFINGQIYGIARVNLTTTTFTVWANNSGGSVSTAFNLTVFEPIANVSYLQTDVNLVAGKTTVRLAPVVEGGVPGSWAIEPALPEGLTFVNGVIAGTSAVNLTPTVFTVWANTTGGSTSTTLTLSVDLPVFFARYPVSRFVLDVNGTLLPQYPATSFDATQRPVWSIDPALPEGMNFSNGVVWGTPLNASNETTYLVTVTGDMAPLHLTFTLEVLDTVSTEVADLTNGSIEEDVFIVPERQTFDASFGMYYICPPILFSIVILGAMAINNHLKRTGYIEVESEVAESDEGRSS